MIFFQVQKNFKKNEIAYFQVVKNT